MGAGRLLLLLLLAIVVVAVVVVVMRRGSAKRDEQRVEAADIRGRAGGIAATMEGQQTFAQQAEERATVARAEAEARAREAQERAAEAARLEDEAAEQRAAAEATRREYETTMRRADDVDPDVKESSFAPVTDDEPAPVEGARRSDDDTPMTRAERREAREQAEAGGDGQWGAPAPAAGAGVGAAGAAAAASSWSDDANGGARDDVHDGSHRTEDDADADSERVASAADYRDDVPAAHGAGSDEPSREEPSARGVSGAAAAGTAGGMSDDTRESGQDQSTADLSRDAESPRGEWGGPRDDDQPQDTAASTDDRTGSVSDSTGADHTDRPSAAGSDDTSPADGGQDVTIIGDIEDFASTEPLLREDQSAPVSPEGGTAEQHTSDADVDHSGTDHADHDVATGEHDTRREAETADEHATAETGAGVATSEDDPAGTSGSQDRFDTTPTRDWAADEGELLEENRDRGDRLEEDRSDLGATETTTRDDGSSSTTGDATSSFHTDTDTASSDGTDGTRAERAEEAGTATEDLPAQVDEGPGERAARRISEFHELRDGGYGVGSAAPLDDGAQPLDHAVAGYRDSQTFRVAGDEGYDDATPDVWFYDEAAAERSGFRRHQG